MMYGTTRPTAQHALRHGLQLILLGFLSLGFCSCRGVPALPSLGGSAARPDSVTTAQPAATAPAAADRANPVTMEHRSDVEPAAADNTWSLSDGAAPASGAVAQASAQVPAHGQETLATVACRRQRRVPCPPYPARPCPPGRPLVPCPPQDPCGPGCCHLSPWVPPGIKPPWPTDEYLFDGGDAIPDVQVRRDWTVEGLDLEDTIIHYDTLDGQTRVQPSNRVCLYAPRFAAVRKVYGVFQHEGHERSAGVELPTPIQGLDDVKIATTAIQPLQPELDRATQTPGAFLERQPPIVLENQEAITGAHASLLPYEDFRIIRDGLMDNSEKARLAQRIEAAIAWTHDKAVQVVIDNMAAKEHVGLNAAAEVHVYELHGKPRVQICKVASRCDARPGEIVEFTIRFDNVGDQVIGNVTIIDNLTTRLEYVEDSQSCSLPAEFSSQANAGESLVLKWDLTDPLPVSQGGVIRFRCRVR